MSDRRTVTRHHEAAGIVSTATYSPCGSYRYALSRVWDPDAPRLGYIMLNPSRATEAQNDPTIERCQRRARNAGFGSFRVCNLFAWCATDPSDLRRAPEPIGPGNDAAIADCADWSDVLVAAWGVHGAHLDRGAVVAAWLQSRGRPLHHFGLTRDGHPRHPLYLSYGARPQVWSA